MRGLVGRIGTADRSATQILFKLQLKRVRTNRSHHQFRSGRWEMNLWSDITHGTNGRMVPYCRASCQVAMRDFLSVETPF
jgi:hypothetical protein